MRNIIALIILSFILTSCAVEYRHNFGNNQLPQPSYIQLEIDDIEYLGETEISWEFSRYLFVGTRVIAINGEHPDNSEKHYANIAVSNFSWMTTSPLFRFFKSPGMSRALYKVYTDFPNADYIEVISTNEKTHRMFLGRKMKKSARVKAYRYKYLNN